MRMCDKNALLQSAILRVLQEEGVTEGMPATVIASRINAYGLYERKDKKPVPVSQVLIRASKYPSEFTVDSTGIIELSLKRKRLVLLKQLDELVQKYENACCIDEAIDRSNDIKAFQVQINKIVGKF